DGDSCPAPKNGPAMLSMMEYRLWLYQFKILFQYSPYFVGTSYYGVTVQNDPALLWGVEYYPDPYVWAIAYDGSYFGTAVTSDPQTIDWQMDWYFDYYPAYWYQWPTDFVYAGCGYYPSYATSAYAAEVSDSSSLDCQGLLGDVWTFESSAGATAQVTVDAPTGAAPFNPM